MRARRSAGRRKRFFFCAGALLLALSPFVLLELILGLGAWEVDREHDPFAGFASVRPLFVPDESGTRLEIAPGRQRFFCPDSFAAVKDPGEYRIFCLGGSTVQGRPWSIETSFTTFLEIALRAAAPERRWEVVNCGGISYASYRLVPILEEVLKYAPDLIIVYTGHNEFLEDRTYAHLKRLPAFLTRPLASAYRLRSVAFLTSLVAGLRSDSVAESERPVFDREVDALLDHRGGLEKYRADAEWRRGVVEHFRFNLRRMVAMARDAGVALLLVNPVSNLRDCPPFKAEHRGSLTPAAREEIDRLRRAAASVEVSNPARAAALLEEAAAIDGEHAGIRYALGRCYQALGRLDAAYREYVHAKELDVCPLRIVEPMHDAILEIAKDSGVPCVDIRAEIRRRSEESIPGADWLVDHVHPSTRGHRLIAETLALAMVARGIVHPAPGWERRREEAMDAHYRALDPLYFARGESRLRALQRWTEGRGGAVPAREPSGGASEGSRPAPGRR